MLRNCHWLIGADCSSDHYGKYVDVYEWVPVRKQSITISYFPARGVLITGQWKTARRGTLWISNESTLIKIVSKKQIKKLVMEMHFKIIYITYTSNET